jgi:hypothetical protein
MPQTHEEQLSALEKSVADIEGLLQKLGAKGGLHYPDSDDADAVGSGKKNTKVPKVTMHKAKKKPKADDGDAEDEEDGGDDEDTEKRLADASVDDLEKALEKAKKKDKTLLAGPSMGKAKKKPKVDEEDDGDMEDDWSEAADSKTKKRAEDEVLMVGDQRIAKSVVGETAFEIFKAQSEQIEKAQEEIKKERDLREFEQLKKRADDSFPHVPGTTEERANMLKVMGKMPEKLRKSFETVMTHSEKMAKSAFESLGYSSGDLENIRKGSQDFEAKVTEIKKRDNCSRTEAMTKARQEAPELFKAAQAAN